MTTTAPGPQVGAAAHAAGADVDPTSAEHTQVWFGDPQRPLFGWVSRPTDGRVRGAVLLCSPIGEEGRASHRTFRRLAETLAQRGLLALRFDYDGQGDSAGLLEDPGRVGAWLDSIQTARQYLLDLGAPSVACVGMRLGATMAACVAAAPDRGGIFTSLVLWDPCASGRSFLREGEALYGFGEDAFRPPVDDLRHTNGFQYDAETATALRGVDLTKIPTDRRIADRLLMLTRTDRPRSVAIDKRLAVEGRRVTLGPATAQDGLFDLAPSDCQVPGQALAQVVSWLVQGTADAYPVTVAAPPAEHAVQLSAGPDTAGPDTAGPDTASSNTQRAATPGAVGVCERTVRLGSIGIVGIVDEPLDLAERTRESGPVPWVVLVNVATEHHVGPGRRWVEWARSWAGAGYRVVRIDQSGVGDSPLHPGQTEDVPFDPHWIDDMRDVVRELRADGARVGLVGLCSGAYSSLEVALWEDVDAVFGVNPRLTLWPAAKGSVAYSRRRRAAMLPAKPLADLAAHRRILAGALWRVYREIAIWHAPLLVLWRVLRRRTAIEVIACHDDAQHFTEVYALMPLFWWMRRSGRFEYLADDVVDHSLLGRRGQLVARERATAFLHRFLPLTDAGAEARGVRSGRGGRR